MQEIVFCSTDTKYGVPRPFISNGTVVLLSEKGEAMLGKYEEPTEEEPFPAFSHPKNVIALMPAALKAVQASHPSALVSNYIRVFECPNELASQADWSGFDPEWYSRLHRRKKATVRPLYFRGHMNLQAWNSQYLLKDAEMLGVEVKLLPVEQATEIRYQVEKRFADETLNHAWGCLCERLREPYLGKRWDFNWKIDISGLIGQEGILVFFDYAESRSEVFNVFEIADSAGARTLAEYFGSNTYYITNHKLDYLFSYWTKDVIFAAGSAIPWFEETFIKPSLKD